MSKQNHHLYEFDDFRLNATERFLHRGGQPVSLPPKAFDILLALIVRHGQVVTKEELLNEVWPDSFVEESNLKVYVSTLRKALGEGSEGQKFIETLPRRGYRFIGLINEIPPALSPAPPLARQFPAPVVEEQKLPVPQLTTPSELTTPIDASPLPTARRRQQSWLLGSVLLLILLALGWWGWKQWTPAPAPARSVAILPFVTLATTTPDAELLGIGLADALITRLSNAGGIIVRPTSAVLKFVSLERDAVALGRKMGVDLVLDGHLQRSGEQIRLSVQLLSTEDGSPLWAESMEEPNGNAFNLQRAFSEKLAHSLTLRLTATQQQKLKQDYTANAAAYEAYSQGRYFYGKQNKEGFEKALGYFRQAIERDPRYALAWAGIADCYIAQSTTIVSLGATAPRQLFAEARAAAERAIALDETLAEPHVSLGAVLAEEEGEAPRRELQRAIALNPNLAQAYNVYALILVGEGKIEEALAQINRARELDPLSLPINTNRANILFRARRYEEAEAQYRKVLEMEPNFVRARYGLGIVVGLQKRYDEAIVELRKAVELSNGASVPLSALGYVYAVSGHYAEAKEVLEKLLAMDAQQMVAPLYVALVYVGLGDKEQAFAWLEKIKGKHMMRLTTIDERFDPLRSDPRLAGLMPQ